MRKRCLWIKLTKIVVVISVLCTCLSIGVYGRTNQAGRQGILKEEDAFDKMSAKEKNRDPIVSVYYLKYDRQSNSYEEITEWFERRMIPYGESFWAQIRCPAGYYVAYMLRNNAFVYPIVEMYEESVTQDVVFALLLYPADNIQTYCYYQVNPRTMECRLERTKNVKTTVYKTYKLEIEMPKDRNFYIQRVEVNGRKIEKWNEYVVNTKEANQIDVYYYPNSQEIIFDANGGEGRMDSVERYYQLPEKLPKNGFMKEGYLFCGWSRQADCDYKKTDEIFWKDEALYCFEGGANCEAVVLYAIWKPEVDAFYIAYIGDKNSTGKTYIPCQYNMEQTIVIWNNLTESKECIHFTRIPSYQITKEESGGNAYEMEAQSSLMGWALSPNASSPDFSFGQIIEAKDIFDKAMEKQGIQYGVDESDIEGENRLTNEAVIRLYAIWDDGPKLIVPVVYVCKKDTIEGEIDEIFLLSLVKAIDKEDGKLKEGSVENGGSGIFIETLDGNTGEKEYWVKAIDRSGNVSKMRITYHILGEGVAIPVAKKHFRFISAEYLYTLNIDSKWRLEEFFTVLREFLGCNK